MSDDQGRLQAGAGDVTSAPATDDAAVITRRLEAVRARVRSACERSGRRPGSVRLLPMSKAQPVQAVRAVLDAGVQEVGENRVQEVAAKAAALAGRGPRFVLTGHLQTNKARQAADLVAEFQALDSLRLARELDRRCQALGRRLPVLVEVNSSGEDSKHGLPPGEVLDFARELVAFEALEVRGLMTLAVPSADPEPVRACFARMAAAQDALRQAALPRMAWDELSMGMTNDFELAIECGATCVRVGRAIFGDRPATPAAAPDAGHPAG